VNDLFEHDINIECSLKKHIVIRDWEDGLFNEEYVKMNYDLIMDLLNECLKEVLTLLGLILPKYIEQRELEEYNRNNSKILNNLNLGFFFYLFQR
jgi:hypothetical protein